jgi:Ca-activated chloride channel family protein
MAIEQKSSGRSIVPRLITLVVLLAIAGVGASVLYPRFQAARGPVVISQADALDQLKEKLTKVDVREEIVTQVAPVEATASDLAPSLPPIETFPIVSNPQTGANSTVVEIFTSTEKSGSGTDGWMTQTAEAFNAEQHRLNDGTVAQIAIRKIASGTAYEFIGYQAYRPDAFSPSNELWIRMAEARGVKMVKVRDRTVGNVAGIVMKEELAERLEKSYGKIDLGNVVEEVVQGRVVAGYTDPFASSTGLNFLVSVLTHFGKGSGQEMLAPEVVSAFEQFQKGVPFVALTTIQMRDSVVNDGSLDTFVMEWQTFAQAKALQSGYRFVPFGQRHDNPLYAVGDLPPAKMEALEAFAEYAEAPKAKQLAEQYGFDPDLNYASPYQLPDGKILLEAQKVWKSKKDAGRQVAAVFLADVSGSMQGSRIGQLQRALREGAKYISQENSIGLVVFSSDVRVKLPIRPFKLLQKSAFLTAVDQLSANGGTAMYDGVAVSLSMLAEQVAKDPTLKPMLFVLTDGETNEGMVYADMSHVIHGLKIPVHTIGFEAKIDELGKLSSLVEAASINAGESDVAYKIGSMLNSQM